MEEGVDAEEGIVIFQLFKIFEGVYDAFYFIIIFVMLHFQEAAKMVESERKPDGKSSDICL